MNSFPAVPRGGFEFRNIQGKEDLEELEAGCPSRALWAGLCPGRGPAQEGAERPASSRSRDGLWVSSPKMMLHNAGWADGPCGDEAGVLTAGHSA